MNVGDLVKIRRMSGLYTPLFGMIVEIKKDDYNCVAIVKPFSGPLQTASSCDVEVISASR